MKLPNQLQHVDKAVLTTFVLTLNRCSDIPLHNNNNLPHTLHYYQFNVSSPMHHTTTFGSNHINPYSMKTIITFTSIDCASKYSNAISTVHNELLNIFAKRNTYRNINMKNHIWVSNHPNLIDTITEYIDVPLHYTHHFDSIK